MEVFDPDRYDVVGIATQIGYSNNSQIVPIGIVDRTTGVYIPVPSSEKSKVFPTRGNVFAYDFFKYNPMWKDECVWLCAKPNNNTAIVDGEDFVWDWKDKPYVYAARLKKLSEPLGEDGQENYDILRRKNLLDNDESEYFIYSDKIFRIDPGQRLIPYWKLGSVSSHLFTYGGNTYLLDDITEQELGKVDITTDDQLIEWYKKKILRKEWGTIYETKDFRAIDELVTAELKSLKIPTNVFENRLGRMQSMNSNLFLTFEELEDLSSTPWFKDVILDTMDRFAELYIQKVKDDHKSEIESLERSHADAIDKANASHKNRIDELDLEISVKQEELESINAKVEQEVKEKRAALDAIEKGIADIDSTIAKKEEEIKRLDSRKDSIIADFSVVREVLGTSSTGATSETKHCNIETIDDKCDRAFPVVAPYRKNLESYLIKYMGSKIPVDEIVTALAAHNVVLVPDNATVSAVLHATRRCMYAVEYVEVGWKSFRDLWDNGLESIVKEAVKNTDMVCFLVLRNINMSYLPCYLQPVIDMQNGLVTCFPGTDMAFPENLRIICTRTSDKVIPVTKAAIDGIGCISEGEDILLVDRKRKSATLSPSAFAEGYLPASVFADMPEDERYSDNNHTDQYIDADE